MDSVHRILARVCHEFTSSSIQGFESRKGDEEERNTGERQKPSFSVIPKDTVAVFAFALSNQRAQALSMYFGLGFVGRVVLLTRFGPVAGCWSNPSLGAFS